MKPYGYPGLSDVCETGDRLQGIAFHSNKVNLSLRGTCIEVVARMEIPVKFGSSRETQPNCRRLPAGQGGGGGGGVNAAVASLGCHSLSAVLPPKLLLSCLQIYC